MLMAWGCADATAIRRKARSIELQAGRASPALAAQLRSLAAQYYTAAESMGAERQQQVIRAPSLLSH
jgi:hypothetical protein